MTRIAFIVPALIGICAAQVSAQSVELSATGGLGMAAGDERPRSFTMGGGASAGWLSSGKHGLQLDYFFANVRRDENKRHFLTGSYVVQQRSGGTRPFLQFGAGLMRGTRKDILNSPSGSGTDFAAILSAGVTVDMGRSFFIRPELRTYWYVGPTVAVLPCISAGWRF